MFSLGKKGNSAEEKKKSEAPLVKKVEKIEEEEETTKKAERAESVLMENNNKKSEVRIGESATIIGTIKGSCVTIIDGCFEGNVDLDADLILSQTGSLRADIKAKNTFISGKLEGTIYATESVQIMPSAVVNGNITSKILVIERGAKFIGHSDIIEPDDVKSPEIPSQYANYPISSPTIEKKSENKE